MKTLADVLSRRRRTGRCGFIPFIVAGDPALKATARYVRLLVEEGADIIELGVPFSDPVADGPAIQAAGMRALKSKTSLSGVLGFIAGLRAKGERTPIILFTYLNPVLSLGYEVFARRCAESEVEGVLVVDLPVEEAGALNCALRKNKIEPVLLASPTTSPERLRKIGKESGSIVYYASREGVTGARKGLAAGLSQRLKKVKALTGKPLIVGFGVASRAQAQALAPLAGGVVVGSALVSAGPGLGRLARKIVRGLTLC